MGVAFILKIIKGNQQLIRSTNLNLIIDLVRRQGPISRADVAKILKLSAPSVSSNTEQLLSKGILEEVGVGDLVGSGRPPILLSFNQNYGYVVAVDLAGEKIRLALGDLNGNVVAENGIKFTFEEYITSDDLSAVVTSIKELLKINNIPNEKLMAICVGTPGILNKETGYFQAAPRFKEWETINIHQIMKKEFDTTVMVINDMNLFITGESRYGAGRGFSNLLGINVDVGIGAGIIIQGQLYEGSRLAAGEVGYWICGTPDFDEPSRMKDYYLDSHLSLHALMNKVRVDLRNGQSSKILDYCQNNLDKITFDAFCKAAADQDPYCLRKTKELVQSISVVLVNMSLLLDIELIVIGGDIKKLGYLFIQPLRELVNKMVPLTTTIVYAEHGERSGLNGGFALALDHVMSNILSDN